MGRNGLNLGLVGLAVLCLAGCPSETSGDTDGDGDTDTDTDATATATMTATSPSTTMTTAMSESDSQTTAQTTTDAMTTDQTTTTVTDTDTDATATDTDPTGDTDTTTTGGQGDECDQCIEDNCGDVLEACEADETCECWLTCFLEGGGFGECSADCEGFEPPKGVGEFFDCFDENCVEDCAPGMYEPCDFGTMCQEDLECNNFVGYCSIDCTMEDCPAPATGDAVPECSDFSDNCILPCDDGTTCPDGMDCNFVGGGTTLCTYGL